ncbi:PTS sugar transporter subunit IIA [Vagococcus jeotgali]|uniref:PTS sugar transporter subunit IIA n=1 Tax=Vagococcus jeotgali TaxID=3109030 RepID=UPI002DD89ECF|nr:PTS glucose transporter subunit IIA [Vagococcus sp. B2T-5]
MLSLFKKKKKEEVTSPIDGEVIELNQVSDPVFSEGMMGPGFAVIPNSDTIFSPITGVVTNIFPTKHAITIEGKDCSVLVHIGIDTVDLGGEGFQIKVTENQKVNQDTILATYDRDFIKSKGKEDTVMVLFPEMSDTFTIKVGPSRHGDGLIHFLK